MMFYLVLQYQPASCMVLYVVLLFYHHILYFLTHRILQQYYTNFLARLYSCQHPEFMVLYVELPIKRFSFVSLSYHQPLLNPSRRSYVLYELNISTNYHYPGHNRSYLTVLPWSVNKKQVILISTRPVLSQNFWSSKISTDILIETS